MLTREQMAQRAAGEIKDGYYVNLGIGIPTLCANFIPPGIEIMLPKRERPAWDRTLPPPTTRSMRI